MKGIVKFWLFRINHQLPLIWKKEYKYFTALIIYFIS